MKISKLPQNKKELKEFCVKYNCKPNEMKSKIYVKLLKKAQLETSKNYLFR